jgi:DnaJ-domain-containing protein 1
MPDLLDRIAHGKVEPDIDRSVPGTGDLLDKMAISMYGAPPDIEEADEQNEEILDIASKTGLSVDDVYQYYIPITTGPNPITTSGPQFEAPAARTRWRKFKDFFKEAAKETPGIKAINVAGTLAGKDTGVLPSGLQQLPPNADRMERLTQAFELAAGGPLRAFLGYAKGRTLNAPDLMWAAIKRITPDDVWDDEVRHMTLDEAMDWAGGYNPSGFQKSMRELAEFGGRLRSAAAIAQKLGIIGNTPKDIGVLGKAFEAAKLWGTASVAKEGTAIASEKIDPTEAEYGYEGPTAVLRDMALGAIFSVLGSGGKALWQKLTPSEHARALKLLDLKEGATVDEIKAAARKMAVKYHPDKVKGLEAEFKKVIKARDVLEKNARANIIEKGAGATTPKAAPKPPTQLPGATIAPDGSSAEIEFRGRKITVTPKKPPAPVAPTPLPVEGTLAAPEIAAEKLTPKPKTEIEEVIAKAQESGTVVSDEALDAAISKEEVFRNIKEKGFVEVGELGRIGEAYRKSHDWLLTFGAAKRSHKGLYTELFKAYGKRNAAVERAISELDKVIPKEIGIEDDVALSIAYETKGGAPPQGLEETYEGYKRILEEIEQKQLEEGILSQPFQERMIAENEARIEELKSLGGKGKQIAALIAENEKLRNMRYLPHDAVARAMIEQKINRLPGDQRKAFLDRLSSAYKKRTGKMTLQEYRDAGLIEPDDMRMSRLAAKALTSYYRRSAMKSLNDYAKSVGLIQPHTQALRDEGWFNQKEIGIIAPELKGQLIHPVYAESLREMAEMRHGRGGLGRQIRGVIKIAQFYNPAIIFTYNAVQHLFRGMYSLNPITEAKAFREAYRAVAQQTELYHRLNEANLYQFPYEVSSGTQNEQIQRWITQHSKEVDKFVKALEKVTDTSWTDPNRSGRQVLTDILLSSTRAIGKITWLGDKVQRTQSYLVLRNMGFSHDEAVQRAAQGHGGYSTLSKKYKEWASKYFFVYSFRLLMPREMLKVAEEPIKEGAYQYAKKGARPPKHKIEAWAKAVAGTALVPLAIDQYMKWRGFEAEGKHLGPLAWKYKKTVVVGGDEQEIVIGMNYILNIGMKYWQRFSAYDPISPETRYLQATKNFAKWELHPLYRVIAWDIAQNRRSFGSGQPVYDTDANTAVQVGQTLKYLFGESFRMYGNLMDAVGDGKMTEKERRQQDKVFDATLKDTDKVLFKVFGYSYLRLPLEQRQALAHSRLQKEYRSRALLYARKYEGADLERRLNGLQLWHDKIFTWIDNGMR